MADSLPPEAAIDAERHQELAEVAAMYYEDNLTQADIAERLGISRTGVSRMLAEAREAGVVQISIRWPTASSLGTRIKQAFALQDIHIVRAGARGYAQVAGSLGEVAAQHIERKLKDGDTLGIAWNTGIYQVVQAFRTARQMGVRVVQLTGSAGATNPLFASPDLTAWLAHLLGGQYHGLPAPLVVDSPEVRDALLSDPTIAETLRLAAEADIVLVGIGSTFPPLCNPLQLGYLTQEQLADIVNMGGVGEILTTFYDENGEILPLELHQRTVSFPLEELRRTPYVIGVAAGKEQAEAIIGAMRGGYLHCLVTDDQAARAILNQLTPQDPSKSTQDDISD